MDVPPAGTLVRAAGDGSVIVARFDMVSGTRPGAPPALLPDFPAMQRPLRMRVVTETARSSRGVASTTETLTLQDASGAHTYVAQRETLDSSYGECARSAVPAPAEHRARARRNVAGLRRCRAAILSTTVPIRPCSRRRA